MNCALEFTFSLHYKFKRPIEIDDVINPLKGIKAILPKTRYILKEYDQLNAPKDVQCYIKEIKAGSLWDDIVVKFIFGSEEAKDKWIKNLRDKLGITAMNNKFPILSPIISSIIACSGMWMLMRGDDEAVKNSIVFGDYAKITIASTSEQLKLPEERLHKILKTIAENPSMARACCNLVEPAKKAGESAELILDETQHIPPEIIAKGEAYMAKTKDKTGHEDFRGRIAFVHGKHAVLVDPLPKGKSFIVSGYRKDSEINWNELKKNPRVKPSGSK